MDPKQHMHGPDLVFISIIFSKRERISFVMRSDAVEKFSKFLLMMSELAALSTRALHYEEVKLANYHHSSYM